MGTIKFEYFTFQFFHHIFLADSVIKMCDAGKEALIKYDVSENQTRTELDSYICPYKNTHLN